MIRVYSFHEAGCIPGIPGTFAGVKVTVDESTNQVISIQPLSFSPVPLEANLSAEVADEVKKLEATLSEIEVQPHQEN
jgi:hypothetical protein